MSVALFEFIIHSVRKNQKRKYKPPVKSSVKIEKKNPLEVLKAAGYSELDNCGYGSPPDYEHLTTFGDGQAAQKQDDLFWFEYMIYLGYLKVLWQISSCKIEYIIVDIIFSL